MHTKKKRIHRELHSGLLYTIIKKLQLYITFSQGKCIIIALQPKGLLNKYTKRCAQDFTRLVLGKDLTWRYGHFALTLMAKCARVGYDFETYKQTCCRSYDGQVLDLWIRCIYEKIQNAYARGMRSFLLSFNNWIYQNSIFLFIQMTYRTRFYWKGYFKYTNKVEIGGRKKK